MLYVTLWEAWREAGTWILIATRAGACGNVNVTTWSAWVTVDDDRRRWVPLVDTALDDDNNQVVEDDADESASRIEKSVRMANCEDEDAVVSSAPLGCWRRVRGSASSIWCVDFGTIFLPGFQLTTTKAPGSIVRRLRGILSFWICSPEPLAARR